MPAAIRSGQFAALSNGMRLHYASAGEPGRPLLLFVHGFPEFWYAWREQLAEFGQDWFAVAPDLRGFNLSDMPAEVQAYKARHVVDDLRLLIGHLGYRQCVLVAHDWGGAAAWNLAVAAPQLLRRLVIINSPHPYVFLRALATDPEQRAASAYMHWLREERAEAELAADGFAKMEALLSGLGRIEIPWFDAGTRAQYHACWARGLRGGLNYYRAMPVPPPRVEDPLPFDLQLNPEDFRVKAPTSVIWGERDIALPASLLDGLEQVVDDLRIERIADATHWVVHEQPGRVNNLLHDFLRGDA